MTDATRRAASGLHLIRAAAIEEPVREAPPADALEALLLAQRGYEEACEAADGATVPSLDDFVD
jgi:hypothetical protein